MAVSESVVDPACVVGVVRPTAIVDDSRDGVGTRRPTRNPRHTASS